MELTKVIKNSIKNEIKNELESIYQEYIYVNNKIDFEIFVDTIIKEIEEKLSEFVEFNEDVIKPVRRRIKKTKDRWYEKAVSNRGDIYKEVNIVAKSIYNRLSSDKKDKFKILYGVSNYEELKKKRLKQLNEWRKNNEIPLTQFEYISSKNSFQIEKAITNDAKFIALNKIKKDFPQGKQSIILEVPELMGMIPYDHTNRVKMNIEDVVKKGYEKYFVDKYYIDDEKYFEFLTNVEILKKDVVGSILKTLNYNDIRVFSEVISRRDENFYVTREIVVDIGDIVKEIFVSRGKKDYMTVKESLYKLQYISSGVVDSSLRGFTVKIFDNVVIDTDKTNDKEIAKIIVNVDIVNEFIKHNTINMYKENIDKFKLNSSKILIFRLQAERIKCDSRYKKNEPLFFKTNINFFKGVLYFSNKKRQENIRMVEDALDEIVKSKVTLKDYERKGDMFLLEFYPVTEQERKDLLSYEKKAIS